MRAYVLSGRSFGAWKAGPRSAAELMEVATHYERAAALCPAPAVKADLAEDAACCRSLAEAMSGSRLYVRVFEKETRVNLMCRSLAEAM